MKVYTQSEQGDLSEGKQRRLEGPEVPAAAQVAREMASRMETRTQEWIERMAKDPSRFGEIEREVHAEARQQADRMVASLLAEATEGPEMAEHTAQRIEEAEVPLRRPEKYKRPLMLRLFGGLVITIGTLYCSPKVRTGQGRGRKGSGFYPELAALGILGGLSPNLLSEIGRLVAMLPIAVVREELARRGIRMDEKTIHRIAIELGMEMLEVRRRDIERFRAGQLPAGTLFAGKSIAVGIDGGRVRVRTVIRKSRVGKKNKRRRIRVEWREPKVLIIYELDEEGRMLAGSRPVIDGTLGGPDQLAELVAYHLHRLGAASAKVVVFVADGAPWIWDRLPWVIQRVGIDPLRVVEVLDWPHAAHHISLALEALGIASADRHPLFWELRGLLKRGDATEVIARLKELAESQPEDSEVWTEIRYLEKHANAGRLRYACFRWRQVPQGSGAIESTIRQVVNLRLKGNGIFWKQENAEAVFLLRAALVSGRWDEQLIRVHEAMARDRRIQIDWEPIDVLGQLKAGTIPPPNSTQVQMPESSTPLAA